MEENFVSVIQLPMSKFWNFFKTCPICDNPMRHLQLKYFDGKYYMFLDCKQHADHTIMVVFMNNDEFNKRNR